MITVNETGPHKGRYLFTVFETGQSGVQRHDLQTGETDTIWQSPAAGGHVAFDACYWTPWGTLITAEETWETAPAGSTSPYGRLFELKNPIDAPGIINPLAPPSNDGADFVHQNVIPRTSHEGIQFDKAGNMYFIDELNGGNVYKYTSAANSGQVKGGQADYFAAGQTFVLRVGDGNTPNATGAYTWVPFTDANGAALPGALTITDSNGVTSVDARNTTNLAAFKGTDYQRPEDMQIQTVSGVEYLYMTTTTTNEVYGLDLKNNTISRLRQPKHHRSGHRAAAVGTALASPDNLAIDHDGQYLHHRGPQRRRRRRHLVRQGSEQGRRSERSGRGSRRAGLRTARWDRSSPVSTSTRPTSAAPGSTSSIPAAATTGRSRSRFPSSRETRRRKRKANKRPGGQKILSR